MGRNLAIQELHFNSTRPYRNWHAKSDQLDQQCTSGGVEVNGSFLVEILAMAGSASEGMTDPQSVLAVSGVHNILQWLHLFLGGGLGLS